MNIINLFGPAVALSFIFCVFIEGVITSSVDTAKCNTEPQRPRYHFSAKKNWINDPNGMIYYDGVYHLYYQYHPYSMEWGPMHWGHAISRDMASWIELPIALYPDEHGTIFSGSAVVDYENTTGFKVPGGMDPIVAIYTSAGDRQRQSIAYSLDGGFTYTKYEGNPVLEGDVADFRDPKVYWIYGKWVMALAVFDRIEFYSSPNLKSWTKESEFGKDPEEGNHAGVWECPDLIPLNVTVDDEAVIQLWVLIISASNGGPNDGSGTNYIVGNFTSNNEGKLVFQSYPWSQFQWMDFGPDNYAGVTFANEPKGRKIFMGWIANGMYSGNTPNVAHRGQMTIPRELGLVALNHSAREYRLTSNPVPELINLRDPIQYYEKYNLSLVPPNNYKNFDDLPWENPLVEIEMVLEMNNNPHFYVCAYNSTEREQLCFGYNRTRWFTDRRYTGPNINFNPNFRSHLELFAEREVTNETTTVRVFLDRTTIELFADDGLTVMTSLHFSTLPFTDFLTGHHVTETGSSVTIKSFKMWGLKCWVPRSEA